MAPTARAAVPAPPAPTTLFDEERIGYKNETKCRFRGAALISIEHPVRLLDLSVAIEAGKVSITK
jgi:hypothetical protein